MNFSAKIVRWALGASFVTAGALKIAHPAGFYSDLLAYEVPFPDSFLRLVAVALPWLEVLCGGALLANLWAETVSFVVACMCLIFVLMLGQAAWRGLDLNCGCFGASGPGWFDHSIMALMRAGVLLVAAGSLWWKTPASPADVASVANDATLANPRR